MVKEFVIFRENLNDLYDRSPSCTTWHFHFDFFDTGFIGYSKNVVSRINRKDDRPSRFSY